ncbi:hypothetical protein EV361DRAFT_947117 [Lentinula raphanica]|nr:hypothetical protein EV361DRAFT_947117 [Lentinula raphanica]
MVRYGILLVLVAISVLQAQAAPVSNTKSVTPLSEGQPLVVHETNLEVRGFKKKFKKVYAKLRGKTGETQSDPPPSVRTESIHSAHSVLPWRKGSNNPTSTSGFGEGLAKPALPPAGESPAQEPPSSPPAPPSLQPSSHPPSRAATPLPPSNAEETKSQSSRRHRTSTIETQDDNHKAETSSNTSRKHRHNRHSHSSHHIRHSRSRPGSQNNIEPGDNLLTKVASGTSTHKPSSTSSRRVRSSGRRNSVSSRLSTGSTLDTHSTHTMRRNPSTRVKDSERKRSSSSEEPKSDSLAEAVSRMHGADTSSALYPAVYGGAGVTSARPPTLTSGNPQIGTANPYANPAETSAFTAAAATLANDNSGIMSPFIRR